MDEILFDKLKRIVFYYSKINNNNKNVYLISGVKKLNSYDNDELIIKIDELLNDVDDSSYTNYDLEAPSNDVIPFIDEIIKIIPSLTNLNKILLAFKAIRRNADENYYNFIIIMLREL